MRKCLLSENRKRGVVHDFAVFDYAAVAVVGVFAQADIGDHDEIELGFANAIDGTLDDAVLLQRTFATRILCFRQSEKDDAGNSEAFYSAAVFDDAVGGLLKDSWHRADFLANGSSRAHEHGIHKACGRETRFANETAKEFRFSQTARTVNGKTHQESAPDADCTLTLSKCTANVATISSTDGSEA